jgi:hypothetical protein
VKSTGLVLKNHGAGCMRAIGIWLLIVNKIMTDHTAHVELLYEIQLDMAKGQLVAMKMLSEEFPEAAEQITMLETLIADVENRLALCQNRDYDNATR